MTFWDWCAAYPGAALAFLVYEGFIVLAVTFIITAGAAYAMSSENKEEDDG